MKYFIDTLSISPNNLACPCNSVFHARSCGLSTQPQFQIPRRVIGLISVKVMHVFVRQQRSSQDLLHDVAMFKEPFTIDADFPIPIRGDVFAGQRKWAASHHSPWAAGLSMLTDPVIVHRAPAFHNGAAITIRSRTLLGGVAHRVQQLSVKVAPTQTLRDIRQIATFNGACDFRLGSCHVMPLTFGYFFSTQGI